MATILAVRHAPVYRRGICYGQIDPDMLIEAAEAIAEIRANLASYPPSTSIWSSPLDRCHQLARCHGAPFTVDHRIMELDFGVWEGLSWEAIHEAYPDEMNAWGRDWFNVAPPRGESAAQLHARVNEWYSELHDGTHLVFTHAGVIRALRVLCNDEDWSAAMERPVTHLAVEPFTFRPSN